MAVFEAEGKGQDEEKKLRAVMKPALGQVAEK